MPTPWSQDIYTETYLFAARAHQNQIIPGTDLPYVMHLNLVTMEIQAALAVQDDLNGDLAVQCALLHDTIEDTPLTYAQIDANFGKAVADGVLALTKNSKLPKNSQMQDSLNRIKQQPHEIWMVKLADRISNLRPPPYYWTHVRAARYREEAKLIHQALANASPSLATRLMKRIHDYRPWPPKN